MKTRICPVCGGKVAATRDDCMHCGYVFHSADSRQYEEKSSSDNKTTVVICPQCNSTDIEILSDGHGKCSYCGATLLLPKTDDNTRSGETIFGVLEDALENLSDTLQGASKSSFNTDYTPIITEEGVKNGKKALTIILRSIFIIIVALLAVVLPITLTSNDGPEPDGPTRPVLCPHKFSNVCDDTCELCDYTRIVMGHKYDNDCDTTCNRCNEQRVSAGHFYTNDCDKTCNVCGYIATGRSHDDPNNDGICDTCQDPFVLQYFTFTLNPDGESYTLTSVSENFKGVSSLYNFFEDITIPSNYNGKPVTAIGSNAFTDTGDCVSLTIPASIITIHSNAFQSTEIEDIIFEDKSDWYLVEADKWLKDASSWMQSPDGHTLFFHFGQYTWTKSPN